MQSLLPLAFGYFVTGIGAFSVAGLLNEIGADLNVSPSAAGQLISVYAFALAVGAPLLAWLVAQSRRRSLIVGSLTLFGILHFAAAAAPSFGPLAAERVLMGLSAAVVTPQSVAAAGLLAAPERRGRAINTLFLGFSLSIVLGVPLVTALGSALGWRPALALIGTASLLSALWISFVLPAKLRSEPVDADAWRWLAGSSRIRWVLATTLLQSAGQFTVFTYFAPVFSETLDAGPYTIGLLFGMFGACGVFGNFLGSLVIDRVGSARTVGVCLALMVASFVLWPLARGWLTATLLVVGVWGLGAFAIHPAQQTRLIAIAPRLQSASIALNLSATYLGQALGSAVGGVLMASIGSFALSWTGLLMLLGACAVVLAPQTTDTNEWCTHRSSERDAER
jgi:predicted MFS family arabinose efflux permease